MWRKLGVFREGCSSRLIYMSLGFFICKCRTCPGRRLRPSSLTLRAGPVPGAPARRAGPWWTTRPIGSTTGARVTVLQQRRLLCRPQTLQPAGHRHLPSNEPRAWPLPWQPFRLGSLPDDPEDVLGIGLFPPREPRALRLLSLAALVSSLCLSIPGDPSGPELTLFCTKSGEWGGILRTGSGQSSAPLAPPRESLARGSCGTRRVPHTCQRLLHPQL